MADIDEIISQARAVADSKDTPAPAPAGTTPPPSDIPSDPAAQATAVANAPAQLPGTEVRSLPPYGLLDNVANTASFGGLDMASGYASDVVRGLRGQGFDWGRGAADYKTARDLYATANPWENLAGSAIGGVLAPLPYVGKVGEAITKIASPVARWAATTALGSGTGAVAGGVTGGVNELPAGPEAALQGAEHGAEWGAGLGAVLPGVAALGTKAVRAARNWLGPVTQAGNEAAVGRKILDASTDPNAVPTAGQLYGPPDLSNVPPTVPLRPSGFPTRGSASPEEIAAAVDKANIDPDAGVNLPGSMPTTAQLTGDPGLTRLEQQVATQAIAKPPEARTPAENDLLARAKTQADAQTQYFRGNIDQTADPQAVKTAVQGHLTALDTRNEANLTAAQQAADRAQQQLGSTTTPEGRGADMRAPVVEARKVSDNTEGALWDAIDPDKTLRIDARDVKDATNQIVRDTPRTDPIVPDSEEAKIFGLAQLGGSAMPFSEFTALRGRLNRAINTERADNGQTPSLYRMTQVRKAMDETIANAAASNFDDGAATRYRAAADFTRQQHEQFGNQFIDPLLATRGAAGDFKVPDTNVGGKIIANNQSAQAYLTAGGDPAMLKGALIDDLNSSLRGGELTPQKLQQFRADREGAIRAVPGLDAEFGNLAGAQNLVRQMAQAKTDMMAQVNTGSVKRVAEGDVQPQISSLLKASPLSDTGRNAASEMLRLRATVAGDPAAEAGLQRAVMQHIDNEFIDSATGQFRTKQFLDFMATKRGALQAAVGSDGMRVLDQLTADLSRQGVNPPQTGGTTRAGRVASTPSALMVAIQQMKKSPVVGPIIGAGGGIAAVSGALPLAVAVPAAGVGLAAMLVRNLRAAGIASRADLLAQAMGNPALARALALKATPANAPLIERAIQGAMAAPRLAPAASYNYSVAQQSLEDRRRRQLYGLPPAGQFRQ